MPNNLEQQVILTLPVLFWKFESFAGGEDKEPSFLLAI